MKPFYPLKRIHITLILVCVLVFLIQCSSSKKISKETSFIARSNSQAKRSKNGENVFMVYCKNDTAYFDIKNQMLVPNDPSILYCLRDQAFYGDSASVQQVSELIMVKNSAFGTFNKKLRGDIIFQSVLKKVNNHDLLYDQELGLRSFTFFNSYGRILLDMIETIDGLSTDEYLRVNLTKYYKKIDPSIDIRSPEFYQITSKLSWELINDSYDKGLIKLKDFGQE